MAALEAGAQEAAPELAAAIRRRAAAAASLKDAAEALRLADDRRVRAAKDRDYLREQIEVAQISERYERYVQAGQSLTRKLKIFLNRQWLMTMYWNELKEPISMI